MSASAAVAGAYLAQKFGRTKETDGFLAAYGVYLVLVLGAQSFRLVVVPDLTRASAEGRLGAETRAYAFAFLALAIPVSGLAIAFAEPFGDAITGSLPESAARIAARALPWLVPAAFAQLMAAVAASALAARDSYGIAAAGYATGAVAGLLVFVSFAGSHGLVALAWGLAVNGTFAAGVPTLALLAAGGRVSRTPPPLHDVFGRIWRLVNGASVPLALQGLYIVAVRLAAGLGVGNVTSLAYAYLAAATLVAATASSLSLVSSAPLTRRGLDTRTAVAHIVHTAWISLVAIAAAAGVFALVGGRLVGAILGEHYAGKAGAEIGRLVVYLSPWMVASIGFSVTFPLIFIAGRTRRLPLLAVAALAVHVPLDWALREAFGLVGIVAGLAATTVLVFAALLAELSTQTLVGVARGMAWVAGLTAAIAVVAFGGAALVLDPVPAAATGLGLYALALAVVRPRGMREAWAYVRALHH